MTNDSLVKDEHVVDTDADNQKESNRVEQTGVNKAEHVTIDEKRDRKRQKHLSDTGNGDELK